MSLLRRLRQLVQKPQAEAATPATPQVPDLNPDVLFREQVAQAIQTHLPELAVTRTGPQLAIGSLTLTCLVGERRQHPQAIVFGLEVRAYQATYFPGGLVDCLAGIGADDADALASGAHNYVTGVLQPIVEALDAAHSPALDFYGRAGLLKWHPLAGPLHVQGFWAARITELDEAYFLRLFQPHLAELFEEQPMPLAENLRQ